MSAIDDLRVTMARLRGPGGCPWDIEQTHQSICDCLVEEVAELLDAIDRSDFPHMREELGDLLLHVVMHAQMASEAGHFNFDDVAREINEKLIRRHPHVFGDMNLPNTEAVLNQWDKIKAAEKKNGPTPEGLFKHLPPKLSALLYAREVFKQIEKKRLPAEGVVDRAAIAAQAKGLDEKTAGKKLFELAAACREAGIDPESALRRHTHSVSDAVEEQSHARAS
ncbi:MAG TPA: MazG family protein [Opitutales bacterium]|jgi:MazG family protein|nr:MazG family protein [Opitutales bacterium]